MGSGSLEKTISTLVQKGEGRAWRILTVVSLLPAVAYLVILMLALLGVPGPASWLVEGLMAGPWSVPLLWALVIGGPVIGVIGSLILELSQRSGISFGSVCGVIAWILLVLCLVTCVPFPWILAIE